MGEHSTGLRRFPRDLGMLLTCAVIVGNVLVFPVVPIYRDVSVDQFWTSATRVSVGDAVAKESSADWIGLVDDYCYVSSPHFHGRWILRVRRADLDARLDELLQLTREAVNVPTEPTDDALPYLRATLDQFDRENLGSGRERLEQFDQCFDAARIEYWGTRRPATLNYISSNVMRDVIRIRQAEHLWYQFAFELIWLTGIIWFVFWPAIRFMPSWRLGLHASALPILFFAPRYLGYQGWASTSVGPQGGGILTWLWMKIPRGTANEWDMWLCDRLPDLLGGLNADAGSIMAVTGLGMWGPTACFLGGILLGFIVALATWYLRRPAATSVASVVSKGSK